MGYSYQDLRYGHLSRTEFRELARRKLTTQCLIARNPYLPEDAAKILAFDYLPTVREAVAKNPVVPMKYLKKLAWDSDLDVAIAALRTGGAKLIPAVHVRLVSWVYKDPTMTEMLAGRPSKLNASQRAQYKAAVRELFEGFNGTVAQLRSYALSTVI